MDPITAAYDQDDADWTITVTGLGKTLTARAPGIIAARDRADQLVEKLAPEQAGRTVVHLLNGSALDFTAAYMQARLSRPAVEETPAPAVDEKPETPVAKPAESRKLPRKPPAAKPAAKPKRTKPAAKRSTKATTPEEPPSGQPEVNGAEQPVAAAAAANEAAANPA